jgi:hypothetical protein
VLASEEGDQEEEEDEDKPDQGQGGAGQLQGPGPQQVTQSQQVPGQQSQPRSGQQPQQGPAMTSSTSAAGAAQARAKGAPQGSQQGPGLSKNWTPPYSPARDWSLYTGGQVLRALGERSFMSFSLLLRRASLKLCVVQPGIAGPGGATVVQVSTRTAKFCADCLGA